MTVVRELRVTDLRCHTEGCGAGPGEDCSLKVLPTFLAPGLQVIAHKPRIEEYVALKAAGWEWQELDTTDIGAKERPR